jgi:tetratricopeptide (TPR) repeat protein
MEQTQTGGPLAIGDLLAALQSSSARLGPYDPYTIKVANKLAIALWGAGRIEQALMLLDQALAGLTSTGSEHPIRGDILCTLSEILIEQGEWERASAILREVLELCIRRSGAGHPSSIAAKGDLASVLFAAGDSVEATQLESEAIDSARSYLGKEHPVRSVLAWNRLRRCDDAGDAEAAGRILVNDLLWLLSANDAGLDTDQQTIKTMLAKRLNWSSAPRC